jgi:solute carrier family 25 carnitine/acylcarnitine transporter 20/29
MQNTQGEGGLGLSSPENNSNLWETAVALHGKFGFGIFFDGISPKLLRAAVNHSVTFFVYDNIIRSIVVTM